jgi:hypothetical protein
MKSRFNRLNAKDLSKGTIMTIGTTLIGLASTSVVNGVFPALADFINMGKVGLLSGAVYLVKNFLTNSNGAAIHREE